MHTAYIVSDLHLGAEPTLEDFKSDDEFAALVQQIDAESKDARADLVLLGDTFDLWQIVPKNETTAAKAAQIDLSLSVEGEVGRLRRAAKSHPKVAAALRSFLQSNPQARRLVIVPGNHDHSLVVPVVQDAFRHIFLGRARDALGQSVIFPCAYDEPALGLYAEHGNQYDRDNNFYPDFSRFGTDEECPGYFFVRLFWNRLEPREPAIDNIYPDRGWEIFLWIQRNQEWALLGPALKFFWQYRTDSRVRKWIDVPGVPFLAAPRQARTLPGMPERLVDPTVKEAPYFSADPATENEYRRLYKQDPKARRALNQLLRSKYGRIPKVPPPAAVKPFPCARPFVFKVDPYLRAAERMFANAAQPKKPYFRSSPLDPKIYRYVVFGHTHEDLQEPIRKVRGAGYFNTGSWISRIDASGKPVHRRRYAVITRRADGSLSATLRNA